MSQGLPSEVYHGLRQLFLQLDEFKRDGLLSDFVYSLKSLSPWVDMLNTSGPALSRVSAVIAYFHNKNRAMPRPTPENPNPVLQWYDGRNALEIFLIELALAYANDPVKTSKAPAELRRMMQLVALTPELQAKMYPLLTDEGGQS